jgi:CRISPR/Cas system-associated exonuclease Cas4 (RecB family)
MDLVKNNEHIGLAKAFGVKEFGKLLESVMGREPKETLKVSFAPSGLGYSGSCPRYWYYAFNGANFEYDNDGPSMANMNAGTDAGARLAKLLDKAGILVSSEQEVNTIDDPTLPPIRGYIDAIVNWKDSEVVVEVKTTKQETWQTRVNGNKVPGYQLIQLLIYMYVTNHDRGFFLTENKNTNELFVLPVKMTDTHKALVENVFDWMQTVKANAETGELPTRPFTKSSFQCKGCAVKNTCWPEGRYSAAKDKNPGTITLPILEIPK